MKKKVKFKKAINDRVRKTLRKVAKQMGKKPKGD